LISSPQIIQKKNYRFIHDFDGTDDINSSKVNLNSYDNYEHENIKDESLFINNISDNNTCKNLDYEIDNTESNYSRENQ